MKLATDVRLLLRRKLLETLRQPVWVVVGLSTPVLYLALFAPLLHGLADSDRPLVDRRLLHRQPELGQFHRRGHQATPTPTRDRAACAIRVASGTTNPSSSGAYFAK